MNTITAPVYSGKCRVNFVINGRKRFVILPDSEIDAFWNTHNVTSVEPIYSTPTV